MRAFPGWIASAPAITLAVASLWLTADAARGGGLWPPDDVTLAEAAATRNAAEVVRLIALGEDPNRAGRVRRGLLRDEAVVVTPLEAAVWIRDEHLVTILVNSGVVLNAADIRTLRCLNDLEPEAGLQRRLASLSPAPWPDCKGFARPGHARP